MKPTTRYFLLLAIAAVTAILFSNCNRGGGLNDDDTTLQLEFDLTEARPYQPISAVYKGGALRNQSYTGTIGSSEIVFAIAEGDNSNSVLVGLIPEGMAPGAKVISVDIDGTTYTHNITILQNETVSDPDALFDDFYTTYTAAEYAQYFDDMADFQAAINELKALPEAEKQIAAQILANNKVAVDALAQSIRDAELNAGVNFGKTGSGCDAPCKIGAVAYVLGGILSSPALIAVGASVLSALVLKRIVIPVVKALITKAWEGVKFALSLGYDRMATIAEMVYDTFLKEISNKTLALPDTIVLERGKPLKLSLKTIREPLIQESNRSQYAFVNSFLDLYNQVKAKLVPLQLALPAINEGQEVRDYATSLDGFAINVQGNSNVTASAITGTPQQAQVTFIAAQPGEQPFTFTYSYTNEGNETTSFTQNAKFKDTDCLNPCNGLTSITWGGDSYQLVEIGCQCWFAENLRYSTGITNVTDTSSWASLYVPAWINSGNNPGNDAIYGKLYNWYAVNTGSLCPSGWHIPTDAEWTQLIDFLGGESVAGGKMKSTTGWNAPNNGATNESGFSALPGGDIHWNGGRFQGFGTTAVWWSSTINPDDVYWILVYSLFNEHTMATRGDASPQMGFSCRCIKD